MKLFKIITMLVIITGSCFVWSASFVSADTNVVATITVPDVVLQEMSVSDAQIKSTINACIPANAIVTMSKVYSCFEQQAQIIIPSSQLMLAESWGLYYMDRLLSQAYNLSEDDTSALLFNSIEYPAMYPLVIKSLVYNPADYTFTAVLSKPVAQNTPPTLTSISLGQNNSVALKSITVPTVVINPGQTVMVKGYGFDLNGNTVYIQNTANPGIYYTINGVGSINNSLSFVLPNSPDTSANTIVGSYVLKVRVLNSDWSNSLNLNVGNGISLLKTSPASLSLSPTSISGSSDGSGNLYPSSMTVSVSVSNTGGSAYTSSSQTMFQWSLDGVNWVNWVSGSVVSNLSAGQSQSVSNTWTGGVWNGYVRMCLGTDTSNCSSSYHLIVVPKPASVIVLTPQPVQPTTTQTTQPQPIPTPVPLSATASISATTVNPGQSITLSGTIAGDNYTGQNCWSYNTDGSNNPQGGCWTPNVNPPSGTGSMSVTWTAGPVDNVNYTFFLCANGTSGPCANAGTLKVTSPTAFLDSVISNTASVWSAIIGYFGIR